MNRTIFRLLLVFCVLLYGANANAQLFTYVTDANSGFTTEQLNLVDSLRQDTLYDSVMVVQVGDIWSLQDSGEVQINLPGSNITQAFVHRVEMESLETPHSEYKWTGYFMGYTDDDNGDPMWTMDGAIHLFKDDGEIYGTLQPFDDNVHYKLISLAPGKNVLIKFNMAYYYDQVSACTAEQTQTPAEKSTASGPCDPVRVLVLYTENAQWGRNLTHEINQAMSLLDGATYNSLNAINAYTKFSLAGSQILYSNQYSTTGNISNDASNLANNTWAQYYRDLYKADIVICLTNAGYSGLIGKVAQIGPNNGYAYAVLEAKYMNTDYAFSHEVGHLMGCRHQQSWISNLSYEDDAAGDDHGYQIQTGTTYGWKRYIDIMHENYNGARRDHLFSTPGVIWRSKIYGTTSGNNTALTLLENHCTVQEFRSDDFHPFDATITGPVTKTTGYTVNLTGNPINGFAGYDFDWWLSFDGGLSWYNHATQTFVPLGTISFTMPDVPVVLVWMKATDGVNQTKVVFRTIYNDHPKWMYLVSGPSSSSKNGVTSITESDVKNVDFSVSPNPARNVVSLNVKLPESLVKGENTLVILDIYGKEIARNNVNGNRINWKFDAENLPAGTYFAKLQSSQTSLTRKFTIIK